MLYVVQLVLTCLLLLLPRLEPRGVPSRSWPGSPGAGGRPGGRSLRSPRSGGIRPGSRPRRRRQLERPRGAWEKCPEGKRSLRGDRREKGSQSDTLGVSPGERERERRACDHLPSPLRTLF